MHAKLEVYEVPGGIEGIGWEYAMFLGLLADTANFGVQVAVVSGLTELVLRIPGRQETGTLPSGIELPGLLSFQPTASGLWCLGLGTSHQSSQEMKTLRLMLNRLE